MAVLFCFVLTAVNCPSGTLKISLILRKTCILNHSLSSADFWSGWYIPEVNTCGLKGWTECSLIFLYLTYTYYYTPPMSLSFALTQGQAQTPCFYEWDTSLTHKNTNSSKRKSAMFVRGSDLTHMLWAKRLVWVCVCFMLLYPCLTWLHTNCGNKYLGPRG